MQVKHEGGILGMSGLGEAPHYQLLLLQPNRGSFQDIKGGVS